jgi:hypothetical protein
MKSNAQIWFGTLGTSNDCVGLINRFFVRRGRVSFIAQYPPDALVIPCMPIQSEPIMAFPESPTTMFGNNRIERFNYRHIPRYKLVLFPVIRRP